MGAQVSLAPGFPEVASFQEQLLPASSQEEEGPSFASWEGAHMGCWHHTRARRIQETRGRWLHRPCGRRREWCRRDVSLLKFSSFVDQALNMLFHPFLTVVFHIFLYFLLLQCVFLTDGESRVRSGSRDHNNAQAFCSQISDFYKPYTLWYFIA